MILAFRVWLKWLGVCAIWGVTSFAGWALPSVQGITKITGTCLCFQGMTEIAVQGIFKACPMGLGMLCSLHRVDMASISQLIHHSVTTVPLNCAHSWTSAAIHNHNVGWSGLQCGLAVGRARGIVLWSAGLADRARRVGHEAYSGWGHHRGNWHHVWEWYVCCVTRYVHVVPRFWLWCVLVAHECCGVAFCHFLHQLCCLCL